MNTELEELYQQVILDHSKRPRNFGEIADGAIHVDGDNPSCGDEIHLNVRFGGDGSVEDINSRSRLRDQPGVRFADDPEAEGQITGGSRGDADAFHDLVTEDVAEPPRMLGDLRVMQGVRKFPQRVKCAMLAWRAFEQARESAEQGKASAAVSTEEPEGPTE